MKQITPDILKKVIQKRPKHSFKGTFGKVLIIGGNENMGGAAIMSGSAAVHAGAGLVTIATASANLSAVHVAIPEAMFIAYDDYSKLNELLQSVNVIVLGPGLGNDHKAVQITQTVIQNVHSGQTLIIDASAITIIAKYPELKTKIDKTLNVIYTPHQMEWQRLSGILINDQGNQFQNQCAQQALDATVILKKHHSEIYFPNHTIYQLLIGGPEMATGGMGDTLTGILAAFISQFRASFEDKVKAALYTHSKIADELANEKYVVLPTDIIDHLQNFMKQNCQ